MIRLTKIITTVIHWCKLFKSKRGDIGSSRAVSAGESGSADKTNVTTKRSVPMNDFLLRFCSDRFKKAMREKVIPILRIVADETINEFDDAVVKYLEELFKLETKTEPEPETEPENET